jgi:hypothetical protein
MARRRLKVKAQYQYQDGTQDHIQLETDSHCVDPAPVMRITDGKDKGPHVAGGYDSHCIDRAPVKRTGDGRDSDSHPLLALTVAVLTLHLLGWWAIDKNYHHILSLALIQQYWIFLWAEDWFSDNWLLKCSLLRVTSAAITHFTSVGEWGQYTS